jgi:hypothetical protein
MDEVYGNPNAFYRIDAQPSVIKMSNPFDSAWALLKGITQQDAIEWIKHYQSQHEEGSEEWQNAEDRIDRMGAGYYNSKGLSRKWGPPPAEYVEHEITPPEGYKPATPEQLERLTLEQIMNLPRINSNQERLK